MVIRGYSGRRNVHDLTPRATGNPDARSKISLTDARFAEVEREIAACELLIAGEEADPATVEDQIFHESTRTIVHEDPLLFIAVTKDALHHVEDDVAQ